MRSSMRLEQADRPAHQPPCPPRLRALSCLAICIDANPGANTHLRLRTRTRKLANPEPSFRRSQAFLTCVLCVLVSILIWTSAGWSIPSSSAYLFSIKNNKSTITTELTSTRAGPQHERESLKPPNLTFCRVSKKITLLKLYLFQVLRECSGLALHFETPRLTSPRADVPHSHG